MPDMVNLHGIIVNVREGDIELSLSRGLRMAEESDYKIANSDRCNFRVGRIDGYEEGALGSRPVSIIGQGDSRSATPVPWEYRIIVNPRGDSHRGDAALALDDIAWETDGFREWRERNPKAVLFAPRFSSGSHGQKLFTPPLHPQTGRTASLAVRQAMGATKACHFSGVAAMLVGRFLTTGPVVLRGFDLRGQDTNGVDYMRQAAGWRAACEVLSEADIFAHAASEGPAAETLPAWLAGPTDPERWLVLGGGPSARRWKHYAEGRAGKRALVATCNAGLRRVANPDLYWLSDSNAVTDWGGRVERLKRWGTDVVSPDQSVAHHLLRYDVNDESYHGRSSGVMAIRAVLKFYRPKEIVLCGFDGWQKGEMEYVRHGRRLDRRGANEAMVLALKRLIADYPDVAFTWAFGSGMRDRVES